jgi:hypothetical protein
MIIKRQPIVYAAAGLVVVLVVKNRVRVKRRHHPPADRPFGSPSAAEPAIASGVASPLIGLEVPEADALEQRRDAVPEEPDVDHLTSVPWEVPEADLLDQLRDVTLDDEVRDDAVRAEQNAE